MTILWIALGTVALIIGTPVIVGIFLPERYVGHARAHFAKSPDQVWDALLDYDKHLSLLFISYSLSAKHLQHCTRGPVVYLRR